MLRGHWSVFSLMLEVHTLSCHLILRMRRVCSINTEWWLCLFTVAVEPVGSDEVMHVNHHHYQQQQQQQRRQHSKQQSETETEIEDRDEVMARPIERLSDVLLTRVFYSGLRSDELCRCAAVCRRWNRLVWNPLLWTCIDLTQAADCDTDAALRSLSSAMKRRLSLSLCLSLSEIFNYFCEVRS